MTTETFDLQMMSLFEFLGRPAGTELGNTVYRHAKGANVPVATRLITNRKYTGRVMTYPRIFLEGYFAQSQTT